VKEERMSKRTNYGEEEERMERNKGNELMKEERMMRKMQGGSESRKKEQCLTR